MSISLDKDDYERLKNFIYHADIPPGEIELIERIRKAYVHLALELTNNLPESRSKSLALMSLEDSLMRAIQALAVATGTPQCDIVE